MHNWHRNGFPAEYRGYVVERTPRGFFAYEDIPGGDDFSAEDLNEVEATIDAKRWDAEQDAEWEREHARAEAAGRRLDATLSAVSAEIDQIGVGK